MQPSLDQRLAGFDAAGDAFADAPLGAQRDHRRGRVLPVALLDRRLHRLQLLGIHLCRSSVAEMLWMRPKPATKRASRGVIRQKEKSARVKLIACSGKR